MGTVHHGKEPWRQEQLVSVVALVRLHLLTSPQLLRTLPLPGECLDTSGPPIRELRQYTVLSKILTLSFETVRTLRKLSQSFKHVRDSANSS